MGPIVSTGFGMIWGTVTIELLISTNDEVLQDEAHADRRDQRGEPRGVSQRPIGQPLDHDADDAHDHHRHGEREHEDLDQEDRVLDGAGEAERGQEATSTRTSRP